MPFTKWYRVMAFMSFTKKGISAKEMQRQLGHKRYNTIWRMMHKVRTGMGKRDELYQLSDMVELDEGRFTIAVPEATKLKRGKGSQRQQNVAVMAESTPLENAETGEKTSSCRFFKMKVLNSQASEDIRVPLKTSDASLLRFFKLLIYIE